MVILCPSCSTSFNLPDEHITQKGSKLRCSKCGHIFRVRRDSVGTGSEIFYKDIDRRKNQEQGTLAPGQLVPPEPSIPVPDKAPAALKLSHSFEDLFDEPPKSDEAQSGSTQFGFASFMDSEGAIEEEEDLSVALDLSGFDMSTSTVEPPISETTLKHPKLSNVAQELVQNNKTNLGQPAMVDPSEVSEAAAEPPSLEPSKPAPKPSLPKPKLPKLGGLGGLGKKEQTSALFPHAGLNPPEPKSVLPEPEPPAPEPDEDDAPLFDDPPARGSLFSSSLFGDEASVEPPPEDDDEPPSQEFVLDNVAADPPEVGSPMLDLAPSEDSEPKIDLFGSFLGAPETSDDPDPFGDAFDDDEPAGLDFASLASEAARIDAGHGSRHDRDEPEPILTAGQPQQGRPVPEAAAHAPAHTPEPAPDMSLRAAPLPDVAPKSEADSSQDFWSQNNVFDDQSSIDPNFDEPTFDPSPPPAAAAPPPKRPGPPPPQIASRPAPIPTREDTDDFEQPATPVKPPHTAGGSGLRKVVNFSLIVCLVTLGFFGVVAALNDMHLDFKQFGSMIEVAFGGGTYKPRPEWVPKPETKEVEVTKPEFKPLEISSVFVETVKLSRKAKVYVVRGMVANLDAQDYIDVQVRVRILDKNDKEVAKGEVPLGALLSNADLKAAKTKAKARALLPTAPARLKVRSKLPFTLLFEDLPEGVAKGEPMFVRVDFAKKVGERALE